MECWNIAAKYDTGHKENMLQHYPICLRYSREQHLSGGGDKRTLWAGKCEKCESFFWTPLTSPTLNPIESRNPCWQTTQTISGDFWRCSTISTDDSLIFFWNEIEITFHQCWINFQNRNQNLSCRWKNEINFPSSESKSKALSGSHTWYLSQQNKIAHKFQGVKIMKIMYTRC